MPDQQTYPDLKPRPTEPRHLNAAELFAALKARYAQSPAFAKAAADWEALERAITTVPASGVVVVPNQLGKMVEAAQLRTKILDAVRLVPVDDFGSIVGHAQITMKERIVAALEKVTA